MRLRVVGAAALLVSAAVHLIEWLGGVRNQSVGPLFLVNVVAGVVIAGLLVRWRHWLPAFLTLGFGAATFGAFLISATVGLLGVHATLGGVLRLRRGRGRDRVHRRRRPPAAPGADLHHPNGPQPTAPRLLTRGPDCLPSVNVLPPGLPAGT